MKKRAMLAITLFIVLFMQQRGFAAQREVVPIGDGAALTYGALLDAAYQLEKEYPQVIDVRELGRSTQGRPIVDVVFTSDVQSSADSPEKCHLGVTAGLHGRESISSVVSLKALEIYCRAYEGEIDPELLFDVRDLARQSVLHLLLCANPDGMEISLRGGQPNWKANANGVDLNRNFSAVYYDDDLGRWVNYFYWDGITERAELLADKPGPQYFGGYGPDSEVETRIVEAFFKAISPRLALDVHARGKIIYYDQPLESEAFRQRAKALAYGVSALTGYVPQDSTETAAEYKAVLKDGASGYITDWLATELKIPGITVELAGSGTKYPLRPAVYVQAIQEFKNVPLYMLSETVKTGYSDYKVYLEDRFYQDYPTSDYADRMAQRLGGISMTYAGVPKRELTDALQRIELTVKETKVQVVMSDVSGRLLAPARRLAEAMGLSIYYDDATHSIYMTDSIRTAAYALERKTKLDAALVPSGKKEALLLQGQAYVDLEELLETFDFSLRWEPLQQKAVAYRAGSLENDEDMLILE